MRTHNISFYEDLTKIIFQLSSNTHLFSSSEESQTASANQKQVLTTDLDLRRQALKDDQ